MLGGSLLILGPFLFYKSDVTPISSLVLIIASIVTMLLSIAGGLLWSYAPGEPNAFWISCTRSGAALPAA